MDSSSQPIMVSIRCLAYNHEPYIRQCLEGFVMQKTNFLFEAIVHDDASTDGTAAIIREYAEKFPDIIKPIFETENQYSKHDGSLRRIMDAAMRGKYIAMCEGDDYWTDPLKLQKQVVFLESHEDYSMCYSDYETINAVGDEYVWPNHVKNKKRSYSGDIFRELLKGNYVQTLTVVYRTDIINDPLYVGGLDYALSLQCALLGKCCYMNEQMGCYRLHQDSAIHTMNIRLTQISIEIWERYVERYLSKKDHRRPFWEHCRICGTIDACLISKKRSGNEQTEQAKRILSKHPELKKYMWLGVLNRVRHSIQKRLA